MKKIAEKGINILVGNQLVSKKLFYIITTALFLVFVVYAYFLATITINTAQAKGYDSDIKEVMSEIATLEVDYLESVSMIDMEYARSMGFYEIDKISFIHTGEEAPSVALLE